MIRAIYPGSFDPVTYGHLDIIDRMSNSFDQLIVGVMVNPNKSGLFNLEERVNLIEESLKGYTKNTNIQVVSFSGLLVDYMKKQDINVIVKGLRSNTDYEYEFRMSLINKKLYPNAETHLIPTSEKYSLVSSSMVKELHSFGGDISEFVPPNVLDAIKKKI